MKKSNKNITTSCKKLRNKKKDKSRNKNKYISSYLAIIEIILNKK
jgi:hypothetical protein